MTSSARRPILALAALSLVLGACGSSASVATPGPSPDAPVLPSPSAVATAAPSQAPDQGNVGRQYPELSVEQGEGYIATVTDPDAKAWRFEVRGLGILAEDRLVVTVEVSDVAPAAEGRIYARGALVDVFDMNGMVGDETVAAGGCHPTLQICFGSDGLALDPATGRASLVLERIEPGNFAIQGATADWPGEPFILGPWRLTEPFTTS